MTRAQVATLAQTLGAAGVVVTSAVLSERGDVIEVVQPERSSLRWDFTGTGDPVRKRTPKRLAALVRQVMDASAVAA